MRYIVLPRSKVAAIEKRFGRNPRARETPEERWKRLEAIQKSPNATCVTCGKGVWASGEDRLLESIFGGIECPECKEATTRGIEQRMARMKKNPIEPIYVRYTGPTLWRSINVRVKMGDRVVNKRLRVKLARNAILETTPGDMRLQSVPIVTRIKGYTWLIDRKKLEPQVWSENIRERQEQSRRKYLQ